MAIETRTRIWNGLAVYEAINTSTGAINLYGTASSRSTAIAGGTDAVLASSTPSSTNPGRNWTIDDATTFRRLYNNRRGAGRGAQLSPNAFSTQFHNNGATLFNNDRTDVLNTQSATARNYYANTLGIPGITNSINQVVSPSGTLSSQAPVATQQPGTLTDGSINLNEVTGTATQSTGSGGGAILRYPEMNLGPLGYDYIQIRAYDFVGSMSTRGGTTSGNARFTQQVPHTNPITIQLPMQPNISEANATDWAQDTMNAMQMAAGRAALSTIEDAATTTGAAVGAGAAVAGGPVAAAGALAAKAGFEVAKEASKLIASENVAGAAAYFAGQAVGANVLGRTTGQVINPNMELTFNGPKMRTFNFGFRMTPRTPSEARIIRNMIKFFKQYMAPEKTESTMFLNPPKIFRLEYLYNGSDDHPWLNKFKPCALTQFTVNYTPDGSYMTYDDGSMTCYNITMGFNEMEPVYSNDYADGSMT